MINPRIREALRAVAHHSSFNPGTWTTLVNYTAILASRHEITEDDAAEMYDIVRAEYDKALKRAPLPRPVSRETAIARLKQVITQESKKK